MAENAETAENDVLMCTCGRDSDDGSEPDMHPLGAPGCTELTADAIERVQILLRDAGVGQIVRTDDHGGWDVRDVPPEVVAGIVRDLTDDESLLEEVAMGLPGGADIETEFIAAVLLSLARVLSPGAGRA